MVGGYNIFHTKYVIRYTVFLLSLLGFVTGVSAAEAQETFPYTARITVKTVNLRAGQNANFEAIGQLKQGDEVVIVGESFDWRKVKLTKDAKAFVNAGFVKDLGDGIGKVTGNRLNIRAAAVANASLLGQLKKDQLVRIIEKTNDWYRIEPSEGSYGWVLKECVEFKSAQIPAARVVQAPIRNVAVRPRVVDQPQGLPPGTIAVTGVIEDLAEKTLSEDIRHSIKTDSADVYYLQGYRHVIDGFLHQRVKIEGRLKTDFRSDAPVVLVTRINLVL